MDHTRQREENAGDYRRWYRGHGHASTSERAPVNENADRRLSDKARRRRVIITRRAPCIAKIYIAVKKLNSND